MKVRSIILSLAAAALLAAPTTVLAQGGPGGGGWGGDRGFGGGFGSGQGNSMLRMLEHRLDHFAERLNLDEDQVAEIEKILADHNVEVQPLVDQAQALGEEWRASHAIGDFNEVALRMFLEDRAKVDIEIKMASASAFAKIWAVLTPEQQEQLGEMRGGSGAGFKRGQGGRRVK